MWSVWSVAYHLPSGHSLTANEMTIQFIVNIFASMYVLSIYTRYSISMQINYTKIERMNYLMKIENKRNLIYRVEFILF